MLKTPPAAPAIHAQPNEPVAEKILPSTGTQRAKPALPREIGGRDGPEPTRFGDWEKGGRCIDF
ncbi:MAG: DUF1674 domain-containing protein [Steroidobacteraceae bacterium]